MNHPHGAGRHHLSSAMCGAQGIIQQCQSEATAGSGQEPCPPWAMHNLPWWRSCKVEALGIFRLLTSQVRNYYIPLQFWTRTIYRLLYCVCLMLFVVRYLVVCCPPKLTKRGWDRQWCRKKKRNNRCVYLLMYWHLEQIPCDLVKVTGYWECPPR